MKRIKLHKFFIVALFIWIANSIATMKLSKVAIIGLAFLLATLFVSCGTNCTRTKRYWRNHRCVQHNKFIKDNIPTYKHRQVAVR